MRIAVLSLQGAFEEHRQMLLRLGADPFFVRETADWKGRVDGLVLPGGESTAMVCQAQEGGLWQLLQERIAAGLPVFGTCAGMILLDRTHLNVMDIQARRNAYGRQLGSFRTIAPMKGLGEIPMTFIRAPYVEEYGDGVEVLAECGGRVVAVRQRNMLATAFHPELDGDPSVHRYFLQLASGRE